MKGGVEKKVVARWNYSKLLNYAEGELMTKKSWVGRAFILLKPLLKTGSFLRWFNHPIQLLV